MDGTSRRRWWWWWTLALVLWAFPATPPLFDGHDSLGHLAPALSAVDDGDLFYLDEFDAGGMPQALARPTATGMIGNHWSPGLAAIVWPSHAVLRATGVPEADLQPTLRAVHAITGALGLLTIAGLMMLVVGRLREPTGTDTEAPSRPWAYGVLVAVCLWLGTPLWFYGHAITVRPHVTAAAVATGVVLATLAWRKEPRVQMLLLAALGLGALALLHSQALALAIIPGLLVVHRAMHTAGTTPDRLRRLGLDLGALLLPVALAVVVGGRLDAIIWGGTGGSLTAALTEVEWSLGHALVHPHRGLLVWSPVIIPALVGLLVLLRTDPLLAAGCLLLLVVQLYLNGTSYDHIIDAPKYSRHWSGGAGFGARRWCFMVPVFALGWAELLRQARSRTTTVGLLGSMVVGAAWSFNLALFGRHAPGAVLTPILDWGGLWNAQVQALGSLGDTATGWVAQWSIGDGLFPWVVVSGQLVLVSALAWRWTRATPRAQTRALVGVVGGLGLSGLAAAMWLAAGSEATAVREADTIAALRARQAPQTSRTQYRIFIRQARLRSKTDEPMAALRTYERAFTLGFGQDTLREYVALSVLERGPADTLQRLSGLARRHGAHPALAEAQARVTQMVSGAAP
ncbi:MAG: hypothetical protein K0V04_25875 [Deltaproteobacteria bacterium]|nr:hypothetical protein [Deltaproteobacteria bacterium]